jgi:hypothetical protein
LRHRFGQNGVQLKEWSTRVNGSSELQMTKEKIVGQNTHAIHKLQSAHWSSYLTAYLVRCTKAHYEIFVPALSSAPKFKRFPAKGAYYKALTAAEVLQFAHPLPTIQSNANYCADEAITFADFRERVWPEQWNPIKAIHAALKEPIATAELRDQQEIDEGLAKGKYTGRWGSYSARGKTYHIKVDKRYPNGDYLCVFEDNSEARVPLNIYR